MTFDARPEISISPDFGTGTATVSADGAADLTVENAGSSFLAANINLVVIAPD
jgi:hypothetical protein